jgi:hypothetical protein
MLCLQESQQLVRLGSDASRTGGTDLLALKTRVPAIVLGHQHPPPDLTGTNPHDPPAFFVTALALTPALAAGALVLLVLA